jgi:hypothetical protein
MLRAAYRTADTLTLVASGFLGRVGYRAEGMCDADWEQHHWRLPFTPKRQL